MYHIHDIPMKVSSLIVALTSVNLAWCHAQESHWADALSQMAIRECGYKTQWKVIRTTPPDPEKLAFLEQELREGKTTKDALLRLKEKAENGDRQDLRFIITSISPVQYKIEHAINMGAGNRSILDHFYSSGNGKLYVVDERFRSVKVSGTFEKPISETSAGYPALHAHLLSKGLELLESNSEANDSLQQVAFSTSERKKTVVVTLNKEATRIHTVVTKFGEHMDSELVVNEWRDGNLPSKVTYKRFSGADVRLWKSEVWTLEDAKVATSDDAEACTYWFVPGYTVTDTTGKVVRKFSTGRVPVSVSPSE